MPNSPSFKLTRRRLLSEIGAVGIASAGAGLAPGTLTLRAVVENLPGSGSNPSRLLVCARVE